MKPHQIIKRPLLTEKSTRLKETGGQGEDVAEEERRSKVAFEVRREANKVQIAQAIEALFSVKVLGVHTQIVPGKLKRVGRFVGKKPRWKKAIVTLAAGDKIEFFEGI